LESHAGRKDWARTYQLLRRSNEGGQVEEVTVQRQLPSTADAPSGADGRSH
jgi:hypothetical protein